MARPDGRIEKGQRLSSAISARAWNRAQEAADRVLGAQVAAIAEATRTHEFPGVRAVFFPDGNVNRLGRVFVLRNANTISAAFTATDGSITTAPAWEKSLAQAKDRPLYVDRVSPAGLSETQAESFCVNVDNENTFVVSGVAIALVRVFNELHRCARLPRQHPNVDNQGSGYLDSAFYGPAKVLGYWVEDGQSQRFALKTTNALVYPANQLRWALIQF